MEKLNTWILKQYVALQNFGREEEGQDFAEYALIFALVVLAAVGAFALLGPAISAKVQLVVDELT